MSGRRLARALHRARFVYFDDQTERVYAWTSGQVCDTLTVDGSEIDSFLIGDVATGTVSEEEAISAIEERAREDRKDS